MKEIEQFYPIFIALIFNAIDLLSGIIGAYRNKDIQSSKLRDGLFKKVGFILCYFMAWLIDTEGYQVGFELGARILPVVLGYACLTESVSIIENINIINPDLLPENLLKLFHLNEKGE